LIDAGKIEFARHGVEGANLTDILRAAGVSPGAFYHQFDDKMALFLAVVAELGELLRRMIREGRASILEPDRDILAWLEDLYMRGIAIARDHRDLYQIFMREMYAGNPRVHAYLDQDRALFRREIADGLQQLVDDGRIPPIDTRWASHLLWVLGLSATAQQLIDPAADRDWARAMARFTIGGAGGLVGIDGPPPAGLLAGPTADPDGKA
jgi:AcrR family transcriptional regulator